MEENLKKDFSEDLIELNRRYLDIINYMPNIVYWINLDCKLRGFNQNFLKLFEENTIPSCSQILEFPKTSIALDSNEYTPYQLLEKYASWPKDRLTAMELDDMGVIFSGKSVYDSKEQPINLCSDKTIHYLATRIPLFDKYKKVNGLLVILADANIDKITTKQHKEIKKSITQPAVNREKPIKILMVEDNLIAQKVEENVMLNLGCEVDIACSGEQALALFEINKYDLIFMDISLKDTSGYIVAKKIRAKEQGFLQHVPIIALTAYKAEVIKYDCSEYFMEGVITKPLTSTQAEQVIQSFIYHQDVKVDDMVSTALLKNPTPVYT